MFKPIALMLTIAAFMLGSANVFAYSNNAKSEKMHTEKKMNKKDGKKEGKHKNHKKKQEGKKKNNNKKMTKQKAMEMEKTDGANW